MMHKSKITKCVLIALLVITFGYSQSKKRTKKEVFTVNKDVTLEINTSHADVEFDTWNKNKVEIEATIEIEDATEEEIEAYFKKWNFKAIGNSEKVTVTSKGSNSLFGNAGPYAVLSDPIVIDHGSLPLHFELSGLAKIPDLPNIVIESMKDIKFDMEAFEENGEAYMKEWQKQWKDGFDEKKFKEGMEKWKVEFEKHQEELAKLREVTDKGKHNSRVIKIEELAKVYKDVEKYNTKELLEQREELLEKLEMINESNLSNATILNLQGKANKDGLFYISSGNKHFKVKKTIKIKMPKKAKLKLNVRHGEVTLASTSENMNAKLSHAALYANVIDGANTTIESSYAPVHVTKWNNGSLKVNFVDTVDLQLVNDINLMSNSSNVSVGTLEEKGIISGTFGNLLIHNVSDTFKTLDIILENTDARIQLPASAFKLYYIGSNSKISYPESVIGTENKTQFNTIVRGFQKANNTGSEININAKYSEVSLQKKS
ncbi:hypothetical protein H2O64_16815 [Kordia sp. YSTF-M3]|uniref:DUF4097 family beta strand repeat protein n=1 Tax=Kordia aestuariivivens TaxID=2759037 RepID=A0ABR7QCR2_9FLAO|nr:hypothetical protein [Kordia aestuariivivens]MBC8756339.1 hypothetical protein [Kordia aestuariivivens]